MRKADKIAAATTHVIRVREYAGAYIATGGGRRTSCTQGAIQAANAHAFKLFNGLNFTLTALAETGAWRATVTNGERT